MKISNIIEDLATGTLRILDDSIIYSKYSDKTIYAIDLQSRKQIWASNQKFISVNDHFKNFLCNGNVSLYSLHTGETIYNSDMELWFSSLTFNNLMLFKQIVDETITWFIFDSMSFTIKELHKSFTDRGNAIYFDDERIIFRKKDINCFAFNGDNIWNYPIQDPYHLAATTSYNGILFLPIFKEGIYALDTGTGQIIWQKNIAIGAFDREKGLMYVLTSHLLVIDAITGEEVIKVDNWLSNQIEQYPALQFAQTGTFLSEEYLVFASRTMDDPNEGGVFFIDKTTAEVKEYFRIVFEKDPFQRKDWYGNKIPDDKQIPFMPLETPIYKDGRLYVVLPSAIDGQKDLYIYEREV